MTADWFVDNEFEMYGAQDRIWSFDGYKAAYEAMVANDPDVFNLHCNCGAPH